MMDDRQLERYSRHILLSEIGMEGQERILAGSVLIIGLGGLGSPLALYLAAAGVGTIGLADGDAVELSNLQRQIIHHVADIGSAKVESARRKVEAINPEVRVRLHPARIMADNMAEIIAGYDFIIDATDNFPAKFLINDACVLAGKPFSHGGILRFSGQSMTHLPGTACYRCMYPVVPDAKDTPTCGQAGVLGPVAGMLGTIQATEALKYLAGSTELLTNRLLTFDALKMVFESITVDRRADCPVCGERPTIGTIR